MTIVEPSPTAKPVPRNRNAGARVFWNVPMPTTEGFTRSIVAGTCAPAPGTPASSDRREREPRDEPPRYIRADGAPAMSGEGSATLASYGWSSLGKWRRIRCT